MSDTPAHTDFSGGGAYSNQGATPPHQSQGGPQPDQMGNAFYNWVLMQMSPGANLPPDIKTWYLNALKSKYQLNDAQTNFQLQSFLRNQGLLGAAQSGQIGMQAGQGLSGMLGQAMGPNMNGNTREAMLGAANETATQMNQDRMYREQYNNPAIGKVIAQKATQNQYWAPPGGENWQSQPGNYTGAKPTPDPIDGGN